MVRLVRLWPDHFLGMEKLTIYLWNTFIANNTQEDFFFLIAV